MKKIFTLVAAVMLVSASFAQHGGRSKGGGYKNDRDVVYNDSKHQNPYDNRRSVYSFSPRERETAIVAINREYDRRSREIRFRSFMSPIKRSAVLRQLERERQMEINQVWAKFNSPNNVFGDKYGYGKRHY